MKHTVSIAYIRQLCSLGLYVPALIPDLLKAFGEVIPSTPNLLIGMPSGHQPAFAIPSFISNTKAWLDIPTGSLFKMGFSNSGYSWQPDSPRWDKADPTILIDSLGGDPQASVWFYGSERRSLCGAIRNTKELLGIVVLNRMPNAQPFCVKDQALLLRLLPYLTKGWQIRDIIEEDYVYTGESCLLILDQFGEIAHLSDIAPPLLYMANYASFKCNTQKSCADATLQANFIRLARNFKATNKRKTPLVFHHQNMWGRFTFRAEGLHNNLVQDRELIAITISREEPRILRTLRTIHSLSLSPTQMELCLLIAQERVPCDVIAEQLHIKPSTLKEHLQRIYQKLNIHGRNELVDRLMSGSLATSITI